MLRFFLILMFPVSLTVWYYNYWAVGCGRCSYADFWRIGPHTIMWFVLILIVSGVWLFLHKRTTRNSTCRECNRLLEAVWSYCPDCGARGR